MRFFDPDDGVLVYRGDLPHWRQHGTLYFVTFRLADSLPQSRLREWRIDRDRWLADHPHPHDADTAAEYWQRFPARLQKWLDQGLGSCILREAAPRNLVEAALVHFDGDRYRLDELVVAPNHVHVLVQPTAGWSLSQIVQSWKSFTGRSINRMLDRTGPVWQREYFDHIVRSAHSLEKFRTYIRSHSGWHDRVRDRHPESR